MPRVGRKPEVRRKTKHYTPKKRERRGLILGRRFTPRFWSCNLPHLDCCSYSSLIQACLEAHDPAKFSQLMCRFTKQYTNSLYKYSGMGDEVGIIWSNWIPKRGRL